ncbi:hypothetical protein D3C84_987660 [compost metagenome]
MRAFLHQYRQQLEAYGVELEQFAFTRHFQGIEVVAQIADLQGSAATALGPTHHGFDPRCQF